MVVNLCEGIAMAETTGFPTTLVRYDPTNAAAARTVAASIPGSLMVEHPGLGTTVEVVVGSNWSGVDPVVVKKPKTGGPRTANDNICK